MERHSEISGLGSDSNALILPAKKKNKRKGRGQENKGFQQNKHSKISKSEKRKLKKLEEENEKALMLQKSIENFEKYKIPDSAYSLLRSSKDISRLETVRDRRMMAVHFSKAGLEVQHSEQSLKTNVTSNECKDESENSDEDIKDNEDIMEPRVVETLVAKSVCRPSATCQELVSENEAGLNAGSISVLSAEEDPCQIICKPVHGSTNNSSLALSSHSTGKTSELMDKSDQRLTVGIFKASNLQACPLPKHNENPIVVQVVRPKEVEEKRRDLPIIMMEQEIMEAIHDNPVTIICGETGCGKTTQVPQFLYEAGFGSNLCAPRSGIIGVTQPRRVAVLATARRVAYELGVCLGKDAGFQVRHDKRIGEHSAIKFMTDGILLREMQSDFLLRRYSVIILDEAHERSLNTDILIGMLSRIIRQRQKIYEDQQKVALSGQTITPGDLIYPLKLVLMSATMRVEDFISGGRLFFPSPPVIEVPARQFPVTIHFSKRTDTVDYIGQAYKKVLSIHRSLPQGGILVFLTGQREVEYLCQRLRKASKQLFARTANKRKVGNDNSVSFEINSVDGIHMKDINDACNVEENSTDEPTDRFSSNAEDMSFSCDDESDYSYSSETESDVEVDHGYIGKQSMLDDDASLLDVLGEEGSIASLKAAFDALSGNTALVADSEAKQISSMTEDSLEQSNCMTQRNWEVDKGMSIGELHVLPLYAMLPAAAQLRVFEEVKEGDRLVVVTTNVAETSLTIPGVKYVVDTGKEKAKKYNRVNGVETFDIQWISKASAAQRAGRAGRTGPGHCYRLYSSAVFNNIFPDFSCAEISKVPADSIVLYLKSMDIPGVVNFPFPTPPETTALEDALKCLLILGALTPPRKTELIDDKQRLTPLGKAMAYYPMSPRHSRMLLAVVQIMKKVKNYARANLVLAYAVAAAAALSTINPFLMQFEETNENTNGSEQDGGNLDKQKKLMKKKLKESSKVARAKFSNPSSDALTVAYALQCFELSDSREEFCRENSLHLKTMEEMSMLRKQLLRLIFNQNASHASIQDFSWTHGTIGDVEKVWRVLSNKTPLLLNEEEVLGQAICAGWADRVAKRIRWNSRSFEGERKVSSVRYEAYKVEETVYLHRWSSLHSSAPEFLVYNELLQTKYPYIRGATSVKVEWLVKYAMSLFDTDVVDDPRPYYDPQTDQVYHWFEPKLKESLWQLPLLSEPAPTVRVRVGAFACALLEGHVLPCLRYFHSELVERPSIILEREAAGLKRVGNLIRKLETKSIDSCAMLREAWEENPEVLHAEILDWFKKSFHGNFGALWSQMHAEVKLDYKDRFPKTVKKVKRRGD